MTLQERGKLGNATVAQQAAQRAEALRLMVERGECLKRAAWALGVSDRTARRYRKAA